MSEWKLENIRIEVKLGPHDDKKLGVVVKSKAIPIGVPAESGPNISVQEATNAEHIEFWPSLTMKIEDRRQQIFESATKALETAEKLGETNVGFFTLGLEVARVPSWEIAEEIVKAVYAHSKEQSQVETIVLVASSPTQLSSFQYTLNNASLFS
ncbi:MAG: hypothetical protein ACXADL_05210 [Candidatus Thorarchaeota archaeon]|jgi:hypothetical protein